MKSLVSVLALVTVVAAGPATLDTLHNVGVAEIVHPVGTIDSGIPIVPRVLVRNYGMLDESLSVSLMFEDGWFEVIEIPLLGAQREDTVEFPLWTPLSVDSMTVWSWTECPTDSYPEDDTAWVRFLVGVLEVGMEPGGVPDTLESAAVYRPMRWVYNQGNVPAQFDLVFNIVPEFRSVAHGNIPPGGRFQVVAPDSWTARPGTWPVLDSLIVTQPDTLVMVLEDTLVVTGPVPHDLAVSRILAPSGQIDTLTMVIPRAELTNNGPRPETCMVWFWVTGPAQETVYCESIPAIVERQSMEVMFRPTRFTTLGPHEAVCSLYCHRDEEPLNNVRRQPFEVAAAALPDIRLLFAGANRDTVDTTMPIQPLARLKNFGGALDSGRVWMFISDPFLDTLVYADSQEFVLGPGSESPYIFRLVTFRIPGEYRGLCRFHSSQGCEDSMSWRLIVIATGVAEAGQAAKGIRPAATIVGDCVSLQPGAPGAEPGRADLLDGTGRLVAVLVAGANDVRHLPPGVYFVSRRAADGSGRTATKVVLQR